MNHELLGDHQTLEDDIVSDAASRAEEILEQDTDKGDLQLQQAIDRLLPELPEEFGGRNYYQSILDRSKGGSAFSEISTIRDLLTLAYNQRKDRLQGDDRKALIELGVEPESLLEQCRYLLINTRGRMGIVKITELDPSSEIEVTRTKEGVPCSLVVELDEMPETNIGTIIIGPTPDRPEGSDSENIFTAHPGLPIKPATDDRWEPYLGKTVTVEEVIRMSGDGAYIKVRLATNASQD